MPYVLRDGDKLDLRRARLFLCACVRRLPRATSGSNRAAVELAERYACGQAGVDEVRSMRFTYRFQFLHPAGILLGPDERGALDLVQRGLIWLEAFDTSETEMAARLAIWKDLMGGDGIRFDPAWASWEYHTVRRMAQAIDHTRDFDQMPILGDALEDAGCTHAAILEHCRATAVHVRGCWLLEGLK